MSKSQPTQLADHVRVVAAASLFDGHDAAIQVDAHAIAVSSYQGGHVEFFRYIIEMLKERRADHISVFGGGGASSSRAKFASSSRLASPRSSRRKTDASWACGV